MDILTKYNHNWKTRAQLKYDYSSDDPGFHFWSSVVGNNSALLHFTSVHLTDYPEWPSPVFTPRECVLDFQSKFHTTSSMMSAPVSTAEWYAPTIVGTYSTIALTLLPIRLQAPRGKGLYLFTSVLLCLAQCLA